MTRAWWAYLVVVAVVSLGYAAGPEPLSSGPVFNLLGLSAVLAIVIGARVHRPRRAVAWHWLAAGQALFVAGDVLAYNYEALFGRPLPFPSAAEPFYLAVYPALVCGLFVLVRARGGRGDRAGLIDALIVSAGVATVSWVTLMAPYAHDASQPVAARVISIAYPLGDLLVLNMLVRLAIDRERRTPSHQLLLCAIGALLVTDSVYTWRLVHGGYDPGQWLDLGWVALYALLGASALHPSMRQLSEPTLVVERRLSRPRLPLLASAALLAPGLLAVRAMLGFQSDALVGAAASAILFSLVVLRMAGIVRGHEEAVQREAALRRSGEDLVRSAGRSAVAAAAVRSGAALAPPGAIVRLHMSDEGEEAVPALAASDLLPSGIPPLQLDALAATDAARLRRGGAVTVEAPAAGLPAGTAIVPLIVRGRPRGALVTIPPSPADPAPIESLATLAAQVALALEGAELTEDLVRKQADARLSSLVEHSSDVVCVIAADGAVRYASPSTAHVLGLDADGVAGRPLTALVHPEDALAAASFLAGIAGQAPGTPSSCELRLRHADGSWRHVEALGTDRLADPAVEGIVLNLRDVSERRAFEAELAHQAFHDALTGLPNRSLFRDRVEHALDRHRRDGSEVTVLFLDLDDFKTVNDSLGHAAGDELLREVGRRLRECVRPADTAARLGGDEFAVLLDGDPDEGTVTDVAERILAAFAAPVEHDGRHISMHASIGIAFGGGAAAAEDVLRNADVAMYSAKAQGKGRYELFEPEMHELALTRLELKSDLQRAVDEHEFFLRFQPIVDLATEAIAGVEALLRWEHPQRGSVSPLQVIALAEETGLIVPLGRRILEDACHQARRLQEAAADPALTMSVNVSARQLQREEFPAEVAAAVRAAGIAPETLVLELTESAVVEDTELAVRRLQELKALGVQLAIDDFGTGYSSLNYLRHFPFDVLKIDRSFVGGVHEDPEVAALTTAILDLTRVLGLRAVAEGVEDPAQLARLRELRCAYAQGYLFARPIPAEEVVELVRLRAAAAEAAPQLDAPISAASASPMLSSPPLA